MDWSRYVALGDDTCSVETLDQLLIVDCFAMTENEIDRMETLGVLPDGHYAIPVVELLEDAFRYRAIFHAPHDPEYCSSCELAGHAATRIDVDSAPMVKWDVMGDPRAFALVCDECHENIANDPNHGR
jgi:hypothetical protein